MSKDAKWDDNIEPVPALLGVPGLGMMKPGPGQVRVPDDGPLRGIEHVLRELLRPSVRIGLAIQNRGRSSAPETRWVASAYGVQGFGPSPAEAERAFDREWAKVAT